MRFDMQAHDILFQPRKPRQRAPFIARDEAGEPHDILATIVVSLRSIGLSPVFRSRVSSKTGRTPNMSCDPGLRNRLSQRLFRHTLSSRPRLGHLPPDRGSI